MLFKAPSKSMVLVASEKFLTNDILFPSFMYYIPSLPDTSHVQHVEHTQDTILSQSAAPSFVNCN